MFVSISIPAANSEWSHTSTLLYALIASCLITDVDKVTFWHRDTQTRMAETE